MRITLIITICFLFSGFVWAQKRESFTPEADHFLRELNSFMTNTVNKKEAKELMEIFTKAWQEEQIFTEEQQQGIYKTANKLLKSRAVAFPHFGNYLEAIMGICRDPGNQDVYAEWQDVLWKLCDEKRMPIRKIDLYITQTSKLITENSIYFTSILKWSGSTDQWKLVFDKGNVLIKFDTPFDLQCNARNDSITIFGTKGYADLFENNWFGNGGKVYWERNGFSKEKANATLSKYKIDLKKSYYTADSVYFVNNDFFSNPLPGVLDDKVVVATDTARVSYPHFDSYSKRFFIKNLYPGVDFDGGFKMMGARFIGSGNDEKFAQLKFYRKDTLFLVAETKTFIFGPEQVVGLDAMTKFYIGKDSIFHPGLDFKFVIKDQQVELYRNKTGMSRSPHYNSYHKLEMDVQLLTWKMDEPRIEFTKLVGSTDKQAVFESSDFYSEDRYSMLQGMDEQNPLFLIKNFVRDYGFEEFSSRELANYRRISDTQVKHLLMRLSYMGFISYNFQQDKAIVQPKLYNYIKNFSGKRDYDVIIFNTEPEEGLNASLNLLNNDLSLNGVSEVHLSDSQNVTIYPENQQVVVKANRDFEFDGRVEAGLFTFYGSDFSFEYDRFKINLNNVRALKLKVRSGQYDAYGNPELRDVKTVIEQITGDLLIDNPMNKSGVRDYPEYPIFNSRSDSYVYYDRKGKYKDNYPRDRFYFQVYPYTIDSLDNFTKEGINMKGYFVSSGVFPPFEEALTLQPDYSLGFLKKTPPGGFPLYGGKGTFTNDINLSNEGLRGDGEFKYIASTSYSDNFIFLPDSMHAEAQRFIVDKQGAPVPFPDVKATDVSIRFKPYQDELYAHEGGTPMNMYEEQSTLRGTVKVQPDGLTGWGKMELTGAELTSELFMYNENTFDADTSRFKLKSLDMSDFDFKTENVNAHIDFIERKGVFKSNGEASFVEFPKNQYICYMDQFNWYMDKEEIEMSASEKSLKDLPTEGLSPTELEDIQLSGSKFISIHPNQDSLKFIAPSAKYSLRKSIITAKDVKYIRVGDATVHLGDGNVVVEKKAKMQTLVDARIVANNTERYHTIYNATVNIFGFKKYLGSGSYDYYDENKQKQTIYFDNVALDSTIETYATGKIGIGDNFKLSPYWDYTGKVNLVASNRNLVFDGYARPVHECDTVLKYWVNFETEIDPAQIYIPFYSDSTKDINGSILSAGYYIFQDSIHMYTAFMTRKEWHNDLRILPVSGYVYYDKGAGKYKIGEKEKIVEQNLPGNFLSMHKSICNTYGEGKLGIADKLGRIEVATVGNIRNDLIKNTFDVDLLFGMNFFFNQKCMDELTTTIMEAGGLEGLDLSRKTYQKGLAELVGQEEAEKLIGELALGSFKKIPKELQYNLFFTDLQMEWNQPTKSFVSTGKIGIGSINKTQINRYVEGKVELIKKSSGDQLNIFLEVDDGIWYFFNYKLGQLLARSSVDGFNTLISETKPDDRKMDTEKGEQKYMYNVAPVSMVKRFRAKFEEGAEIQDDDEDDEKTKDKDKD